MSVSPLHLDEGDLFMVHGGKAVRMGGRLKPEQLTAEELRRLSELAAKDAEANSAAREKYQRTRHSAASVINDSPMVVDGLELPVVSFPTGAGNVFITSGLESDWGAAVGPTPGVPVTMTIGRADPQPEQEIGFGPYP